MSDVERTPEEVLVDDWINSIRPASHRAAGVLPSEIDMPVALIFT